MTEYEALKVLDKIPKEKYRIMLKILAKALYLDFLIALSYAWKTMHNLAVKLGIFEHEMN
jgi:hypothetical protein